MQQERRQNVRVRPAPDYDIIVEYEDGPVRVQLAVVDVAVGGVGVLVDQLLEGLVVGSETQLKVHIPDAPPFATSAVLRHTSARAGGRSGFHFHRLTPEQQSAWSRAVSELLERGHSA